MSLVYSGLAHPDWYYCEVLEVLDNHDNYLLYAIVLLLLVSPTFLSLSLFACLLVVFVFVYILFSFPFILFYPISFYSFSFLFITLLFTSYLERECTTLPNRLISCLLHHVS